ncbi:MAG: family 20 glycosylhydrolase [Verrucomicrobia bacterium]|nr:family 20 glycosylhydrolase [Verrucomicrobiota bacterium]
MTTSTPSFHLPRREFLKISILYAGALAFRPRGRLHAAPATVLPPRTLHPYPNHIVWGPGGQSLRREVALGVSHDADPGVVTMMKETWRQFTFGAVKLKLTRAATLQPNEFSLAGAPPPSLRANATYALTVDASGIAGCGKDTAGLRHAWFKLLQLLAPDDTAGGLQFTVPEVSIQDWPALAFRGLHLCIFRETPPEMITKAIRLAAFYKFTHVVLEFWGMLRLRALPELAWPEAWSKAQAGRLMTMARGLGLEIIPMFNCWGHASASRIKHGRHVVLDQNPRLAPLFEPDGWTWCLTNPRTQALLRDVCDELIAGAGPGQYFHIGCDEAYSHATCDRCRQTDGVQLFADHVNQLAAHLARRSRRAIMWGDALLERGQWPAGFSASGTAAQPTHEALDRLSRQIVIADWHYNVTQGDVPTLAHFRRHGFTTLACPWNTPGNIRTLAQAAAANQSGLLMTTWHHLVQSIPTLAWTANCAWSENHAALGLRQMDWALMRATTASHLRQLAPARGRFKQAGWNPFELPAEVD